MDANIATDLVNIPILQHNRTSKAVQLNNGNRLSKYENHNINNLLTLMLKINV